MEAVSLCQLKEKEVINMSDCCRLGYITDICIDITCGKVISFTVKDCSGFLPGKGTETVVPWEKVSKIGCDIIFVDVCLPTSPPVPPKKKLFS